MEKTPTRESPQYRWGQLPDHGADGLYLHGPQDVTGAWELQAEVLGNEAVALDYEYADRLRGWQTIDSRRNFVRWLALHRDMWGYVKLAMRLHCGDGEKVNRFKDWLEAARKMRDNQVAASKREALRLATR